MIALLFPLRSTFHRPRELQGVVGRLLLGGVACSSLHGPSQFCAGLLFVVLSLIIFYRLADCIILVLLHLCVLFILRATTRYLTF
jgi:hypothetical protein